MKNKHIVLQSWIPRILLSRFSHCTDSGLTLGFLRILCNGLCTAQRFHVEGEEQTCRVGCPDEPDSLAHYNECLLLYNFFASFMT